MTLKIQGRAVADGNLGNITDFTQIEADEGRIFETLDASNNLSTWIVSATDNGGKAISGGLYANPLNLAPSLPKPIMSLPFGINQTEEFINGSVSCVRATEKTYTDIYGVLRTAPVNALAIEPDGASIEGASTNLAIYSSDLTNAAWSKISSSITPNADTAPDLTLTSDLIEQSTQDGLVLQNISGLPLNTEITFSGLVKESTSSLCQIATFDGSVFSSANLDLTTGQVSIATGNFIKSKATKVYNNYYRFEVTLSSSSAASCDFRIYPTPPAQAGTGSVYFTGAQVETLGFSTSYIPTASAPATRAADVVTIPTLNNYIGQNEGAHTIYIKASVLSDLGRILSGKSTTGLNGKYNIAVSGGDVFFSNGSTNTCQTSIIDQESLNALAVTFDGAKSIPYSNGSAGTESLSAADSLLDFNANLTIGSIDGVSQNMYGHVKDIKVFNVTLSADQIKLLG